MLIGIIKNLTFAHSQYSSKIPFEYMIENSKIVDVLDIVKVNI